MKYFFNRKLIPPRYAAIAVPESQAAQWVGELSKANQTTTFQIEHVDDGSIVHLRFSRYLPVRLAVWALPSGFNLNVTLRNDSKHVNVFVDSTGDKNKDLEGMCETCDLCEPAAKAAHMSQGMLMNYNTKTCVTVLKSDSIVLAPCGSKVKRIRLFF